MLNIHHTYLYFQSNLQGCFQYQPAAQVQIYCNCWPSVAFWCLKHKIINYNLLSMFVKKNFWMIFLKISIIILKNFKKKIFLVQVFTLYICCCWYGDFEKLKGFGGFLVHVDTAFIEQTVSFTFAPWAVYTNGAKLLVTYSSRDAKQKNPNH